MISSDWSALCEGSAIYYYYLFFLSGFADGIGWELGRMSLQYLETFSWCLRWFFPALSCLSYSIWEMDTLNQVKSLTRTGSSLQRYEIINVLQKCHIRRIPLLVTSKILFTMYCVWWLISLILLYQTPQLREICRKSCSSWSLRSLSWRSSLRWEGQWGLCWQRSWPISKHSRSCAWVNISTTQFVFEQYRL